MTKTIDLGGKIALVTGGGGGIGRAAALSLAGAGADVAIVDIDPSRAEEAAGKIKSLGRRALPLVADVRDAAALEDAVTQADQELGGVDILVNNAGGTSSRPFLEQNERNWRRLIDFNLMSTFVATAAAAPIMIRRGQGGAIINVATAEASRAAPNYAVYAACKAAMVNFTSTMAVELADHGIRVNAIAPDHSLTPGMLGLFNGPADPQDFPPRDAAKVEAFNRLVPLGREGLAEECGDAILFLASSLASYVTGTLLPVDGGTMAASGWVRSALDGKWILVEGL